jgi:Co/Zn/Cd efflux system component
MSGPTPSILQVLVLLQTILMVCQFVASSYISSIALKTNGYHTGMSSLLAGSRIMAEFARRRRPDNSFSFGYGRCG